MNSSCSFTMGSNCWTLLMSFSKFVLVLLATNIVYSSVSIPFPTPEPASSQLPVPASSQLPVPASSQPPVPASSQLPVPASSQPPVPASSQLPVPASSQLPVPASSQPPVPASSQPWPPVPASSQLPCQYPGADPGFQKGGGVKYENWGVVHFRPIQPVCVCVCVCVCGRGVLSALGQFNQWVLSTYGSLYVIKGEGAPNTYMAILETTLLPVCFKLTLD